MQVYLYELRRVGAYLAFVLALVATVDVLYLQSPVVRILEFNGVPKVSCIGVLANGQQTQLFTVALSPYPRYLRSQRRMTKTEIDLHSVSRKFHPTYNIIYPSTPFGRLILNFVFDLPSPCHPKLHY